MSSAKFLKVKAAIYEMGLLFNQMPSEERITAYANALINFEPNQIVFAFKEVINQGSAFFPSLAEILKHLRPARPNVDPAPQIASEMINALRVYGPHNEEEMLEKVSKEARETFLRLGYTGDIRNSENLDTVRAQLERLARSVLSTIEAKEKNEKLEKIGIKTPGTLSKNKPGMKPVNYSEFFGEFIKNRNDDSP